jgi:hypothetical protein
MKIIGGLFTLMSVPTPKHTDNDALIMMHKNAVQHLRLIADHAEKWEYTAKQLIEYMRELADEHEAQAVVVDLRDRL